MALTKVGKKGLQDGALTTTAASAPTVGAKGELFYNTTQNKLYVSNGTAWTMVSNDAPSATGGTVVISTLNEGATFSYNLGTNFTDDSNTDAELTYSLESGTLPGGATLPTSGNSAMTGTVGNVSSNTVYTFSIRATDVAGATATQDYQQQINTVAATVTGGTVTIGAVSEAGAMSYDVDTDFTFGTGSTFSAYSLQSGSLPSGTSLATATGVISGTAGNVSSNTAYTFTIRGTDTDGDTVDQSYSWTINTVAATTTGGTVTISAVNEGSSASYDVDTNFTFGTGSTFSAYSLQSGSLPSGLSFNTSTGVISGTMGTVSSDTAYSFTIRGTDTDGDTADQAYSWTITSVPFSATGGTITTSGGYKYHKFTSSASGASGFVPNKSGSVQYLVVGGGAGGGGSHGGGGGAGGYQTATLSVTASQYTVTVGGGGAQTATNGVGATGGSSTLTTTTSIGGGGGGFETQGGASGASGGGGGGKTYGAGAGTAGQGNSGGAGAGPSAIYGGGGGGGAAAAGGSATGNVGGNGGNGSTWLNGTTYAGGGGGASYVGQAPGVGGNGGGGNGGKYMNSSTVFGTEGGQNTGGGGGAYRNVTTHAGAAGGSGIVIIRYAV